MTLTEAEIRALNIPEAERELVRQLQTLSADLQSLIGSLKLLEWLPNILGFVDFTTAEPASPSDGDAYINTVTGVSSITATAVTQNNFYQWDGDTSSWKETVVSNGMATISDADSSAYVFTTSWQNFGAVVSHLALLNVQGGSGTEQYHMTLAQHTSATRYGSSSQDGLLSTPYASDIENSILQDGTRDMEAFLGMGGYGIKDLLGCEFYYVSDANGNDTTGDGSEHNPYKTVAQAILAKAVTANYIAILADDATYTQAVLGTNEKVVIIGRGKASIAGITLGDGASAILIDVTVAGSVSATAGTPDLEVYRGAITGSLDTDVTYMFAGPTITSIGSVTWTGYYFDTSNLAHFQGLSASSMKIVNLADPTTGTDAVNLQTLTSKTKDKSCHAYRSTTQALANNSWVLITLNAEEYDSDNMHSLTVNPSQVKANSAGKHLVILKGTIEGNGNGVRAIRLKKNGVEVETIYANPVGIQEASLRIVTVLDMAVDDYVTLEMYQSSGGSLNALAGAHKTLIQVVKQREGS